MEEFYLFLFVIFVNLKTYFPPSSEIGWGLRYNIFKPNILLAHSELWRVDQPPVSSNNSDVKFQFTLKKGSFRWTAKLANNG